MWSSKKKEPKASGEVGDLDAEQQKTLDQLKEWIVAENLASLDRWDDYDLTRFCRARKYDLEKVKVMFENMIKWRAEKGVDTIIDTFNMAERAQVQ